MPTERIALVMGNAKYQYATALETPVRDALTVADALERLGFKVQLAQNCNINDFQSELDRFSEDINGAEAALFFYSGHALQYGGENYLLPVDSRLQAARALDRLTFRLNVLLEEMRGKAGVSLVFLDACRDNPFELDPKGPGPGTKRVVVRPSGLTGVPKAALKDALIAFAAEQGKTAADGEEEGLSPFTRSLCEHIEKPGLEVTRMMQLVKRSVRDATEGRQIPWSNDSLTKDFYFKLADQAVQPLAGPEGGAAVPVGDDKPDGEPPQPPPRIGALLPNPAEGIEAVERGGEPPRKSEPPPGISAHLPNPAEGIDAVEPDGEPPQKSEPPPDISARLPNPAEGIEAVELVGESPRKSEPPSSISARLPNLAAGIEAVARNAGPVLLGGLSMTIAVVLLFVSQALNLNWIKMAESGKQVGFMAAPNWSVVYTILFPFYLFLFAILAERVRIMLVSLLKQKVIVDSHGHTVTEEKLFAAWRAMQQKFSLLLWTMLVLIVVQTFSEWLTTCFSPYFGGKVLVVDWTTSAINGSTSERIKSLVFSGMAYLYMGLALYVYLAILLYAAAACNFVNTLADPTGEFRLVLRDEALGKQFSYIGIIIYWSVIMGLGAAFMMRLQAIYLASGHLVVTDLLFNDVFTWLGRPPTTSASAIVGSVPSEWTSLVEMIFTLLMLFGCCVFLYTALDRAKLYYSDNIDSSEWRKMMGINHTKEETDRIRRQPFLKTVFPMYVHFGFIVAGLVASAVFIGHGVIPLVTLFYLVVAFMILPGFAGDRVKIRS